MEFGPIEMMGVILLTVKIFPSISKTFQVCNTLWKGNKKKKK